MLNGYKTYIIGALAIAFGIYLETVTTGSGTELIFLGLGFMGMRHGVQKSQDTAAAPVVVREIVTPAPKKAAKKSK